MKRLTWVWCVLAMLSCATRGLSQDALRNKTNGLKGVKEVALVTRTSNKADEHEVISLKDLANYWDLQSRRKIPELRMMEDAATAPTWIELNLMVGPAAAVAEVSVYRWVLIPGVKDSVFVKTWNDLTLLGGTITPARMREAVDDLLTKLALDYLRGNP
jgi:hypothetical protein